MSNFKKTDLPCPCGDGRSSYAIDKNDNGYCFKCKKLFKSGKEIDKEDYSDRFTVEHRPYRGLNKDTVVFYNILTRVLDGEAVEVAYIFPNQSVQYRNLVSKSFHSSGDMKNAGLWGIDKFDAGGKDSITICEGREDAASIYQVTGGRTAAVAARSSSSALIDCKKDYEKINSFKKIILAFDNDDPGNEAAEKVASLFDFEKVYKVNFSQFKDANDYLQNGRAKELYETWNKARKFTPEAILSTAEEFKSALTRRANHKISDYPIDSLNKNLHGIHENEIIVLKGPEGIGKTEMLRMVEHHLIANTTLNIGILHVEESSGETLEAMASYIIQQPVNVNNLDYTSDDIIKILDEANAIGRVNIHESYDVDDADKLVDSFRFLSTVLNCKVIFFDHVSWLGTGKEAQEDERRILDRLTQKLRLLTKEKDIAIIMIAHTNDDGKTRGSRNIAKVANTVIHLERDKTTNDSVQRMRTYLTIEKARMRGAKTGPAGYVTFDLEKLNLVDTTKVPLLGE